jgi:hypothetical protein
VKKLLIAVLTVAAMSIASLAQAADYADVLFVIDESGSMFGEHAWLGSMVTSLESNLAANGIGVGADPNQYALVGFGASSGHGTSGHKHAVGGGDWGTAAQLSTATSGLVISGYTEDGWEAMNFALNNYSFRSGAGLNVVLITDEDRDNIDGSLTYNGMLSLLNSKGGILNVVVDADMEAPGTVAPIAQVTVLGIDSDSDGYQADGSGGYNTLAGASVSWAYGNTQTAYIDLAWATGGAAWDLNQLRLGGNTATSFTAAFVDIKTTEIQQQQPGPGGVVPEPATMLLFGPALLGLVGLKRKKS